MRYILLLLTLFVIYGCNPLKVIESDCSPYTKDGSTHYWHGDIKRYSYTCFDWSDLDTLVITSKGGSTLAAAQIITDIKMFQITVVAQEYCHSSCTYILSNGIERYSNWAEIGIHLTAKGYQRLDLYDNRVNENWLVDNLKENLYTFTSGEAYDNNLIDSPAPYFLISLMP